MVDVTYALAVTQDDALEAPQDVVLATGWKIVGTATAAQGTVALYPVVDGALFLLDVGSTKKTPAQIKVLLESLVLNLQQGGIVWNTNLPAEPAFTDLPLGTWTPD